MLYLNKAELLQVFGQELVMRLEKLKETEFFCIKLGAPEYSFPGPKMSVVMQDIVAAWIVEPGPVVWLPIKFTEHAIYISSDMQMIIQNFGRNVQCRNVAGGFYMDGLTVIEEQWLKARIQESLPKPPTLRQRLAKWLNKGTSENA